MLGFSYYLNDELNNQTQQYFQSMSDNSFEELFTSLHIPEEDTSTKKQKIKQLLQMAEYAGLRVVIDVDKDSLQYLPQNISTKMTLRLDDGFSIQEIAQLSKSIPIALNASTIGKDTYYQLIEQGVDLTHVEAWHNFYPRPETGLDKKWFQQKNHWLHSLGFTVQAFIPGDEQLRGPLEEGLPTLEDHRYQNLLASAIDLSRSEVDKIFIADPKLSAKQRVIFHDYHRNQIMTLHYRPSTKNHYFDQSRFTTRPDPARDVVRLVEGRKIMKSPINAEHSIPRAMGAITVDNQKYGRYNGELQICKTSLPFDEKVNVIGNIIKDELPLIKQISENQKINLIPMKENE